MEDEDKNSKSIGSDTVGVEQGGGAQRRNQQPSGLLISPRGHRSGMSTLAESSARLRRLNPAHRAGFCFSPQKHPAPGCMGGRGRGGQNDRRREAKQNRGEVSPGRCSGSCRCSRCWRPDRWPCGRACGCRCRAGSRPGSRPAPGSSCGAGSPPRRAPGSPGGR